MMAPVTLSRRRRIGIWSAVVAGAIVAVLAIFAIWTARQLLNESNWTKTNSALIGDPAVQDVLADYLVDQLYANADLTATVQSVLPPRLDALAAPAAGALREPLTRAVKRLLAGPRFQALWGTAAELTHRQFMNLINERGKALRTPSGGGVVLDLRPILTRISDQLGIPLTAAAAGSTQAAGVIVILTPDQLEGLQKVVKLLKTLAIVLFLIAIALFGLAVFLARGHRREILTACALAAVIAAILVLFLRRLGGDLVVSHLAKTESVADAANSVWTIGTSLLAQIAKTMLLLGILLAIMAWLAGPTKLATRLRHWARPALRGEPALVHGVLLAVLLGGLTLGVIPGIRTAAAAVLLVLIAVLGVELVRRQAMADPV
jgi:hypothetical protein